MYPGTDIAVDVALSVVLIVALLAIWLFSRYRVALPRFRLRTLLIVVTVVCVLLALLGRLQTESSATINASQVVALKASAISGGVGLSSDGKSIIATIGNLPVSVDAKRVVIADRRTVQLPAAWARVELTRSWNDVQIVVDGAALE